MGEQIRKLCSRVLLVSSFLLTGTVALTWQLSDSPIGVIANAADCEYEHNLNVTAETFINDCCKPALKETFPVEFVRHPLGSIRDGANAGVQLAKVAYALLNDSRFRK